MPRSLRHSALGLFLATVLTAISLPALHAQDAPAAPVPQQIISAKKAFISNGGEESGYWMRRKNMYRGGPNRVYNEFYAAMKSWGRYELLSTPADADLVLEIQFEGKPAHENQLSTMPEFKLRILDPKTHTTLWVFTSYVEFATLAKTRDKNYSLALGSLVDDLKNTISAQAATASK